MRKFSAKSLQEIATCDPRLAEIANEVLQLKDHAVIKGHRGEQEQNEAFDNGFSKLKWPEGKHNRSPSIAMDVQTHPRPEKEQDLREEQFYLLGMYRAAAFALGITLRTGADWDRDGEISDNGFDDLFHVEIQE